MSRRKRLWRRKVRQAHGNLEKLLPRSRIVGEGRWLKGQPGTKPCTLPITERKEELVREWTKDLV
jgi:hypothetical protein